MQPPREIFHCECENKSKLSDDEILRNWISTIPVGRYAGVVDDILDTCMISRDTFKNWRYGRCRIPAAGKRDLNIISQKISGVDIFDV